MHALKLIYLLNFLCVDSCLKGGYVQMTSQAQPPSGTQALVQVPPPMHPGMMGPPHMHQQPPQQPVAVPLPVPAPAPPLTSTQVSSANYGAYQPGIMTQSGMPLHQQQLPPHLQQHIPYQLPPGNQSPMHGQTAPHGPSSPSVQQPQQDRKSPNAQENGQVSSVRTLAL